MKVWIVAVGEPLPVESSRERLLRAGILSEMLASRGHDVTWWTSTFLHMKKQHVFTTDREVRLNANLRLRLLHGLSYKHNVSARRLIDHWIVARKFAKQARGEEAPDLILCSFPTIELSHEAVKFGRLTGVPVVLDIRDLWPDIFLNLAPSRARPAVRTVLAPYFSMTERAMKQATAIFAVNEGFVKWGVERAGRGRTIYDRAFAMGYPAVEPAAEEIAAARQLWQKRGIAKDDKMFRVMFAGNIGRQFEFGPVIEAARRMRDEPIQFVLCGSGSSAAKLQQSAQDLPNVLFPGWVGSNEIWTLMRMCNAGLAPYHAEESFTHSLPNKSLEYLSSGLPIVSSLPGALKELLDVNDCGITYANGDLDGLQRALRTLMSDSARQSRMSNNAKKLFDAHFSAERVYSDMIDHLVELALGTIANRARPR